MKIRRWIALTLLALPALVYAQSSTQDGQSTRGVQQSILNGHLVRSDSTQDANSGDGSGNLYTREAAPDQTFLKKYQSIIQNSLFRTGAYQAAPTTATFANPQADSSTAKDMIGCNRMALLISYTLDDSVNSAILAIEVRGHISANTDSVSTFPWRGWGLHAVNSITVKDTVGSLGDPQSSSLAFTINTDTTNVAATERPIVLNQITPEHRYLWVPLVDERGTYFAAPYVSIRARIIKTYGASMAALTGKASPKTAVNVDLVGWR